MFVHKLQQIAVHIIPSWHMTKLFVKSVEVFTFKVLCNGRALVWVWALWCFMTPGLGKDIQTSCMTILFSMFENYQIWQQTTSEMGSQHGDCEESSLIFLRDFCGYVSVNIPISLPPRVMDQLKNQPPLCSFTPLYPLSHVIQCKHNYMCAEPNLKRLCEA